MCRGEPSCNKTCGEYTLLLHMPSLNVRVFCSIYLPESTWRVFCQCHPFGMRRRSLKRVTSPHAHACVNGSSYALFAVFKRIGFARVAETCSPSQLSVLAVVERHVSMTARATRQEMLQKLQLEQPTVVPTEVCICYCCNYLAVAVVLGCGVWLHSHNRQTRKSTVSN